MLFRLDILARLLALNLERYQSCSPPVKYVEFSIGANDASRYWIMLVLSQFYRFIDKDAAISLFRWNPSTLIPIIRTIITFKL